MVQGHPHDGRAGPVPRGHGGADAQVYAEPRGARAAGRARGRDRPPGARGQVPIRAVQVR